MLLFIVQKKEVNMQVNIVEKIFELRAELLNAINKNPLPTTVKLLVANELANALEKAEANEIRNASLIKQTDKVVENTDKEE
jgi:hypothetical protein